MPTPPMTSSPSPSSETEVTEIIRSRSLAVLVIVLLTNLLGNVMLSVSLVKQARQPRTDMSPVQSLILQAAIADLAFGILSILPQIVETANAPVFEGSPAMCKSVKMIQLIPMFASSYFVVVLSIDRYIAICRPLASLRFKYSRVRLMTVVTWVSAIVLSIPQLFQFNLRRIPAQNFGNNTSVVNATQLWYCGSINSTAALQGYVVWFSTAAWIAPSIAIAVFYTLVMVTVWESSSYANMSLKYRETSKISSRTSSRLGSLRSLHSQKTSRTERDKGEPCELSTTGMDSLCVMPRNTLTLSQSQIDKSLSNSCINTIITSNPGSRNASRDALNEKSPSPTGCESLIPSPNNHVVRFKPGIPEPPETGAIIHPHPGAISVQRRRARSEIPDASIFLARHSAETSGFERRGSKCVGSPNSLNHDHISPTNHHHTWRDRSHYRRSSRLSISLGLTSRGRDGTPNISRRRSSGVDRISLQKTHSPGVTKRKLQTVKLILTIIICHFLLWAPFCITSLMVMFCNQCVDQSVSTYIMLTGNLNSCVNPWIYFAFHRDKLYGLVMGTGNRPHRPKSADGRAGITSARQCTVHKNSSPALRKRSSPRPLNFKIN